MQLLSASPKVNNNQNQEMNIGASLLMRTCQGLQSSPWYPFSVLGSNSGSYIAFSCGVSSVSSNLWWCLSLASLVAQLVKNPPVMQKNPVQFLARERSAGEGIGYPLQDSWVSMVAQLVKNPLGMRETWVWFLDWEDTPEKRKATHSSILAWRIPWTV